MAKIESTREDLLRDGRNMPLRGQTMLRNVFFESTAIPQRMPIQYMMGFRISGQLSLYCGEDPVFQFNQQHQLRRVFFEATRYIAEQGNLIRLVRKKRGGRVVFDQQAADEATTAKILSIATDVIQALARPTLVWTTVEPEKGAFAEQLSRWLDELSLPLSIADSV